MDVNREKIRNIGRGAHGKEEFEKDVEESSKEAFEEEGFKKDFEKTV
jgi:hypothetical protein